MSIFACSERLQNKEKLEFAEILLSSLLQRLSSGVLRGAVITKYFSVSTGNRWLFAHTVSLRGPGCRDVVFSYGFSTKNAEVHFPKSSRPKMFIFTSHPVHRVVSHKAVEFTCAFSLGFTAISKREVFIFTTQFWFRNSPEGQE